MAKLSALTLSLLCLLTACEADSIPTTTSPDTAATTGTRAEPAEATRPPEAVVGSGGTSAPEKSTEESTEESTHDAQDAVEVIHEYYRAIAARDFDRAYRAWGSAGPPQQTRESFEAGFADTKSAEVQTGEPSRVEPAAGSRYVQVPVTIVATTTSGAVQRFEGSYTMRRSVVDGAHPSDRAWHIHRASIHAVQ